MKWIALIVALVAQTSWALQHSSEPLGFYQKNIPPIGAINAMVQDNQQNLWFGTTQGLARFDGRRLSYPFGLAGQELYIKQIQQLLMHQGHLWVSTKKGLYRLNLLSYKLTKILDSNITNPVHFACIDQDNELWVVSSTGKLYRFNNQQLSPAGHMSSGEADKSQVYNKRSLDRSALTRTTDSSLLFISAANGVLVEYPRKSTKDFSLLEQLAQQKDLKMERLSSGYIVLNHNKSLYFFDHNGSLQRELDIHAGSSALGDASSNEQAVRFLAQDSLEQIWISMGRNTLAKVSSDLNKITHFAPENFLQGDLRGKKITGLNPMINGHVNITFSYSAPQFSYSHDHEISQYPLAVDQNSIKKPLITDAVKAKSGELWLLSNDHRLLKFMPGLGITHTVKLPHRGKNLTIDELGNIWFTSTNGLYRYQVETQQLSQINSLYATFLDSNESRYVWVSTRHSIVRVDSHTLDSKHYKLPGVSLLNSYYPHVDEQQRVWIPSNNQINTYNPGRDLFEGLSYPNTNLVNGSRMLVTGNTLWLGGRGLSKTILTEEQNNWVLSPAENIKTMEKFSIYQFFLHKGDFWLNSRFKKAIYQHHIAKGSTTIYDIAEGFPRQQSSKILALYPNSIVISEQGSVIEAKLPLRPFGTDSNYSLQEAIIQNNNGEVRTVYANKDTIKLHYTDSSVDLLFSNGKAYLDTIPPVKYRLKGWHEQWLETKNSQVSYSGLPPGEYIFELRSALNKQQTYRIGLSVEPPPWRQTWAYSLYTIMILAAALYAGRSRLAYLRKQRRYHDRIRLYADSFDSANEAFCICRPDLTIIHKNMAFDQLFEDVLSVPFTKLESLASSDNDRSKITNSKLILKNKESWTDTIFIDRKNKRSVIVNIKANAIKQIENEDCLVFSFQDDTVRANHERELYALANYDTLTGLPNKNCLNRDLDKALSQDKDQTITTHSAILFLDLDRFKQINDSLSHQFGDQLLKTLAGIFINLKEKNTQFYRLGGDEFVVLVRNVVNPSAIDQLAERILQVFENPIQVKQKTVVSNISIGIAVAPDNGNTVDLLLRNADAAMYLAKTKGGNCFCYYSDRLNQNSLKLMELEADLHQALQDNALQLFYQQKVDMASQQVCGYEALIRWIGEDGPVYYPDQFIIHAEKTGQIIKIGQFVIEEACRQLQQWQQEGRPPLPIAVNVSSVQLVQAGFYEQFQHTLSQYQFDKKLLHLEITESMLMEEMENTITLLKRFRDLGHTIYVDDFGTGYSSLAYLDQLPIDYLKIDQSFVFEVLSSPSKNGIVRSIVSLAEHLNLKIVAEGIETAEIHEFLLSLGVGQGQGYYYHKPQPAHQLPDCSATANTTQSQQQDKN